MEPTKEDLKQLYIWAIDRMEGADEYEFVFYSRICAAVSEYTWKKGALND